MSSRHTRRPVDLEHFWFSHQRPTKILSAFREFQWQEQTACIFKSYQNLQFNKNCTNRGVSFPLHQTVALSSVFAGLASYLTPTWWQVETWFSWSFHKIANREDLKVAKSQFYELFIRGQFPKVLYWFWQPRTQEIFLTAFMQWASCIPLVQKDFL